MVAERSLPALNDCCALRNRKRPRPWVASAHESSLGDRQTRLGGKMGIVSKDDLAREVAEKSGLEVGQAKKAVDAAVESITSQVAAGNEVRLTGFGKFSPSRREARQGRNPQTGETMQ